MRTLFTLIVAKLKSFLSYFEAKLVQKKREISPWLKEKGLEAKFYFEERKTHWPKLWQWKRFPEVLSFKEKILFCLFYTIFFLSLGLILEEWWRDRSQIIPQKAGKYQEALVGQPRFINPLLAPFNDVDRDISQLIFSGLMKYDKDGNLVPDLAEKYEIKEEGKIYEINLKKGIKWQDGADFTVDDVIFTIKILQDPEYTSPLRINWQGVKVEKVDDFSIRFKLENSYAPFLENLTLGILPKHLWENIHPKNFPLADFNIKRPIGTGPYRFKSFRKDELGFIKSYSLEPNPYFYGEGPYLKEISFLFFSEVGEAISAFNKKLVDGISLFSSPVLKSIKRSSNSFSILLPRYFAILFNKTQSDILSEKNVRQALFSGLDRQEIIRKTSLGEAKIISSPILPEIFGFNLSKRKYDFDRDLAERNLENSSWKDRDKDGWREKIIEKTRRIGRREIKEEEKIPLEFTLTTVNTPELELLGILIKEQWQKLGIKVNLELLGSYEVQQERIKPRNYEAILFGKILGLIPDPFSFWHSSQKRDPGLNLALFGLQEADKLLEEARQTLDSKVRAQKLEKFQDLVLEDCPAIFLYSPPLIYKVDEDIKGIEVQRIADPSKRFLGIEKWHIKTKRVWK